jgi:hypothetical protein
MLGLALSTAVTGIAFVALLLIWKQARGLDGSAQARERLSERA